MKKDEIVFEKISLFYDRKWEVWFFCETCLWQHCSPVTYIHLCVPRKDRWHINTKFSLFLLEMMNFSAHFHSCLYTSKAGDIDVLSRINADVGKKSSRGSPEKSIKKPKHWTNSTNSVEDQDFQPSADLYWRFGREARQRCFVLGWDSDVYTTCSEEKHLFVVSEPMFGFGVIVFLTIRAPWKSLKIHHCNFSWPLGCAIWIYLDLPNILLVGSPKLQQLDRIPQIAAAPELQPQAPCVGLNFLRCPGALPRSGGHVRSTGAYGGGKGKVVGYGGLWF